MAINPNSLFPTKTNASSADYSYGSARNVTTPSDGTGTPWDYRILNDVWGYFQALLVAAGITPSGDPDTEPVSQYRQASEMLVQNRARSYYNTPSGSSTFIEGIEGSSNISRPYGTGNLVTNGPFRACCRGWDKEQLVERTFLVIDGDDSQILAVTNSATDFSQSEEFLSITLPTNHVPDSIMSDSDAVYILCHTAATGTAAAVHKFSLNPSAGVYWSSTPVWSTTLTGAIDNSRDGSSIIVGADANNIAVLYNGTELTTGVPAIAILSKSTGTETSGRGSVATSSGEIGGKGLVAVGSYMYFTTTVISSGNSFIHSAQIANPANTAPLLSAGVQTLNRQIGRLATDGTLIVCPTVTQPIISTGGVTIYDTTSATSTQNPRLDYFVFEGDTATDKDIPCVFDGQRFWMLWNTTVDNYNSYLVSVDANQFYRQLTSSIVVTGTYTYIGPPSSTVACSDKARMCFSDGCLWLIPDAGSAPNSIQAQRIPRLMMRY